MLNIYKVAYARSAKLVHQKSAKNAPNFVTSLRRFYSETPEVVETDQSVQNLTDVLHPKIIKSVQNLGFKTFTPVQAKSIRPILENKGGIVARAKTGTGKTLAFGLPILHEAIQRTNHKKTVGLVIAPTRDLALQIQQALTSVVKSIDPRASVACCVGGESRNMQKRQLIGSSKAPLVVVGTPGRINDFLNEERVAPIFSELKYFTLDESDRLLMQGFEEDIDTMLNMINDIRESETKLNTLLFSATINRNVETFAKRLIGEEYLYIDTVDPNETSVQDKVQQTVVYSDSYYESLLKTLGYLHQEWEAASAAKEQFKAIVFLQSTAATDFVAKMFRNYRRSATASDGSKNGRKRSFMSSFHGKMSQAARDRVVGEFKRERDGVLFSSDVGARGMDFPNVTHVIQLGSPNDKENYVHRIGRTARGNAATGKSVLFASEWEKSYIGQIERQYKFKIPEDTFELTPEIEATIQGGSVSMAMVDDLSPVLVSLLAAQNPVAEGRAKSQYVEDLGKTFQKITQTDEKLEIESSFQQKQLASQADTDVLNEYFSKPDGSEFRANRNFVNNFGKNNRGGRNFGGRSQGGRNFGGRNGGRNSYDRNSFDKNSYDRNDRGDRGDRGFRNDRSDRGFKKFDRNDRKKYNDRSEGNRGYKGRNYESDF